MTQKNQNFAPPASLPACALTSLNALSHGGSAETLFLPEEDPAIFFANLDDAFAHHQPGTAEASDLVTQSVHARWVLTRRIRAHSHYEFHLHAGYEAPSFWPNESLDRLNLFDRYKTQAERALRRCLSNVQAIRKDAVCDQHWQDLLALKKQSLALQVEKWEYTKKARETKEAKEAQAAQQPSSHQQAADLIAEVEASRVPIQSSEELGGCVIVQHAWISVENGAAFIDSLTPGHDKVRQIIRQRESYAEPPQEVVRHYMFCHGIPPEYEFLIDEDFPRPIMDRFEINHFMSFEEWETLAAKEDVILSLQPKSEEEDEEE